MEKDAKFFKTARKRKESYESYWQANFKEFDLDSNFYADEQWTQAQLSSREESGRPALTFNQVKQPVLRQINELRQNGPSIKISPKDQGASQETAEWFEGKIRDIQYQSNADNARLHAAKCAAIGGIGYYRVTARYVDNESFDQDLFCDRILDPKTVLYEPCEKPDFSDAKRCFVTERMQWEDYRAKYPGASLQSWDSKDERLNGWADEENIVIAEYWHIETEYTTLKVGERTRQVARNTVHFDKINGQEVLEETIWLGDCIPIIPVIADEVVSNGKRKISGMIRSARDPQKLLNAYASGQAEAVGLTNRVPYIGPKGTFKTDRNWRDAHLTNPAYLEYDIVYDQNGARVDVPPERQAVEPAIQALSQAVLQQVDAIKRAMGYADDVINPSQSKLSGVAEKRRSLSQETANYNISDALALAMWREGKIYLDVLPKILDTPRQLQLRSEAGDVSTANSTIEDENGETALVPGAEDQFHHILNRGRYDCAVDIGPDYATKAEEESDMLPQVVPPEMMPAFLDIYFKLRGYPDLEERAKLVAPPAVQQATQGQQPLPPQAQQAMAENQLLKAQVQQLSMELATKKYAVDAKHDSDMVSNMVKVVVAEISAKTQKDTAMLTAQMEAIAKKLEMFHESELAPGPDAGPLGIHPTMPPQPEPAGGMPAAQ